MGRWPPPGLSSPNEMLDDLRRVDAQIRESKKRLAAVVAASSTTTTKIFGVGPVVAATVIGLTGDIARFPTRDRFAAYNGTAPIEVSSGNRKIFRLSRRGNRTLNHAIHMAAVTQIRHRHSDGRAFYDRKIAEGKSGKEAIRVAQAAGQRCALRVHGRRRPQGQNGDGPGRATGERLCRPARPAHTPQHRLFGQATPGPDHQPYDHPPGHAVSQPEPDNDHHQEMPEKLLDKQRGLVRGPDAAWTLLVDPEGQDFCLRGRPATDQAGSSQRPRGGGTSSGEKKP